MNDETVLQFGHSLREHAKEAPIARGPAATSCPTCGSRFSPDGRFCPFDGSPLIAAVGWDPSQDALIGNVIDGRYEVLSVIGVGGMGTVYQVRHRALGKLFALKALRQELAQDPEIAPRFIQEARTAAAVSHPGLVEITDFGRLSSGQVYFVMELLHGQSLAALLRTGGPLPAARGLQILLQLVRALKAAHDAGIVHRDLKPDNIHVGRADSEGDVVKIVDFGLAKVAGSSKLTRSGMVFGTPHYMSPEQAAGEPVDHRADIYALGIVMYEMFTGKVPFEADSYMGVLTKHMYVAPTPPGELSPALKSLGALEDVILRCLQKRPQARYPDLAALLLELEQRLPEIAGPGARSPGRAATVKDAKLERAPATERGFRYWPVLALALAFAAGVALVFALKRGLASSAHNPALGHAPTALAPAVAASPDRPATAAPRSGEVSEVPSTANVGVTNSTASSVLRPPPPARKPTLPRQPGVATPAPKAALPGGKRRLGGGEIVDPWAD